jgi:hypothetical protein
LGSDGSHHDEKFCCAAGCSDLQNCSTVMDLMICHSHCQIPHSMISSFVVAPHGFYSKAYSKGIMRYWNLQTMNASSVRWCTVILFKSIF